MTTLSFPDHTYALILGASSGFGAATARACARNGVHVVGVHLDRGAAMPAVEALQAEIRATGVEAHFFNVNAADPVQRATVLDSMGEVFAAQGGGSFRLLMHSLAFGTLRPFIADDPKGALTQAQMEMTMNVMANSLVYWTQDVVARGMMTSGGRVVAMTSSGSHRVLPHYGAVSAAKAALESYCRQLAFELGPKGITVNAIQAGVTVTPALQKIPGADKIISHAEERNPLGRLTSPEDIASALMMVMSDGFGWLNGTVLRLDGGEDAVELDWTRRE